MFTNFASQESAKSPLFAAQNYLATCDPAGVCGCFTGGIFLPFGAGKAKNSGHKQRHLASEYM
jgi:hypothetical protein